MEEKTKILRELTSELFNLMGVEAKADVSFDKENDAYVINVEGGEETGLLIGKKGETLSSIQTILGVLFKQKIGEWGRIILNVGDYREKEEDYLKNLANSVAQRAVETGEAQNIYNLKPWQRRVIHMYLSENSQVSTESLGEGEERYLVVKVK